jgi:hypothetical protein
MILSNQTENQGQKGEIPEEVYGKKRKRNDSPWLQWKNQGMRR